MASAADLPTEYNAGVVKLADTHDSGSCSRTAVGVQVSSPAQCFGGRAGFNSYRLHDPRVQLPFGSLIRQFIDTKVA